MLFSVGCEGASDSGSCFTTGFIFSLTWKLTVLRGTVTSLVFFVTFGEASSLSKNVHFIEGRTLQWRL